MHSDVMLRIVSTVRFRVIGTGPELNCHVTLGCGFEEYGISTDVDWPSFSTSVSLKSSSFMVGATANVQGVLLSSLYS